ncbi:MAG: M23 family metallopeptidase [Gemmatimonadota bacterium]
MRVAPELVAPILLFAGISACAQPNSMFVYRLPYEDGTDVEVWQDHETHPLPYALDLAGQNDDPTYRIVAARPGTVRFIRDQFSTNCDPDVTSCFNNFVWIQHAPGEEWTKYSHVAEGSVTSAPPDGAGLVVGSEVVAGQWIGNEGNVGMATGENMGRHLHFEVVIPDDPETAQPTGTVGDFPYDARIPRFCVGGDGILVKDDIHEAGPCPS